ncbi:hypothetical protein CN918_32600 [Priestia megaterium]|nr:hypothetical protein CN918_32600 [Priestia megaterium]
MIKYVIFVKEDEKSFHQFESYYEFSKNKNIGDVLYVRHNGEIHSLTVERVDTHDIKENEHTIRLYCRHNKFFS